MNDIPAFKTANELSMYIEKRAAEKNMTHIEAVLEFCDQHFIEPADIATKINKSLREKLEQDFRNLNYLPKQAQIDV